MHAASTYRSATTTLSVAPETTPTTPSASSCERYLSVTKHLQPKEPAQLETMPLLRSQLETMPLLLSLLGLVAMHMTHRPRRRE